VKGDLSTYAEMKLRILKLTAIERAAGILATLSHGLILVLFGFFSVLFLFMALGFFLAELLGSMALGFLLVGGIYLLLTLLFILAQGTCRLKLMNKMINAFQAKDDDDDEKKD
jgi:hypothetical protein